MRNMVIVNVYPVATPNNGAQLMAHFCNPALLADDAAKVEIKVSKGKFTKIDAPSKLQGSDFNLLFPLHVTTDATALDFSEIETIMVVNGVAHNVVKIELVRSSEGRADWMVTYNEAEK